ncbi:MAG TPA: hypothetical protein VFF29_07520 [Bacteroidota bacterium]|nr:hypothetical protein [Bacteroidota bacterium]
MKTILKNISPVDQKLLYLLGMENLIADAMVRIGSVYLESFNEFFNFKPENEKIL